MRTAIVAAVLCCLAAGMLEAQAPDRRRSRFSLLFNSGLAVPVSPDPVTDVWKPGLTMGAAVRYRLTRSLLVDAYFEYSQFAGVSPRVVTDDQGAPIGISGVRGGNIYAGYLDAIWYPFPQARSLSPYLMGGMGYATSNQFGSGVSFPVGGGLLVMMGRRTALFGDARYVFTNTPNSLRYATLRAGVTFR